VTNCVARGRVSRGRIGVQIDQVSKDVAESIGLGQAHGRLGARRRGGLACGAKPAWRRATSSSRFDGKPIEKSADLPRMVGSTKPGNEAAMTVFRRGANKDLAIVIAEVEPDKPTAKAQQRTDGKARSRRTRRRRLGFAVRQTLLMRRRKELKIKGGVRMECCDRCQRRVQDCARAM